MSRGVLVTGASRGIGAAVAHAFAAQGDRVAVHYGRVPDAAERGRWPRCPVPGTFSCRRTWPTPTPYAGWWTDAADALGGLDVLVNNAGVFLAHPPLTTDVRRVAAGLVPTLSTNLVAAANATFCAVPHLLARGRRRGGQRLQPRGVPRGAGLPRLRRVQGGHERLRPVDGAGPRTAGHQRRDRRARVRRDRHGPPRCSTAPAATRSARSRPPAGWRGPRRWPRRCCGSARRRRASRPARSST